MRRWAHCPSRFTIEPKIGVLDGTVTFRVVDRMAGPKKSRIRPVGSNGSTDPVPARTANPRSAADANPRVDRS